MLIPSPILEEDQDCNICYEKVLAHGKKFGLLCNLFINNVGSSLRSLILPGVYKKVARRLYKECAERIFPSVSNL